MIKTSVTRFPLLTFGLLAAVGVISRFALAEAAIDYERVLVPIFLRQPLPGAYGSLWTTDLWIRNNSAEPVDIQAYTYPCLLPEGCFPMPRSPAATSFHPKVFVPPPGFQGTLLSVERRLASEVEFQLRLKDLARQSMTAGAEVPFVRAGGVPSMEVGLLD